jgi:serine/threonine protein kinase
MVRARSGRFVQLENRRSYARVDPSTPSAIAPLGAALLALSEVTDPIRPMFKFTPAAEEDSREERPVPPWLLRIRALSEADVELHDSDLALVKPLGEGAFAAVTLHRLELDTAQPRAQQLLEAFPSGMVALKRMKRVSSEAGAGVISSMQAPSPAPAPDALELVLRTEAALLKMVPHANVVRSIGCVALLPVDGQGPPETVLVEEYLPGGTLRDQLRSARYTSAQAIDWLLDLSSGLQALHEAFVPIAHRDLKPENVMLAHDGVAKLVDLGLARLMRDPHLAREDDTPGTPPIAASAQAGSSGGDVGGEAGCGTGAGEGGHSGGEESKREANADGLADADSLADGVQLRAVALEPTLRSDHAAEYTTQTGSERYMAPECYAGPTYDHRVDCFSFAILAYELLACARAYDGLYLTSELIVKAVATRGLRPAMPAHWPAGIKALLERCWSEQAQARPEMREVYSELLTFRDAHDADELETLFKKRRRKPRASVCESIPTCCACIVA